MTYLESSNTLADEQNGFRSNRSCDDHIFTLNGIIRNHKTVFAAFIDLQKAFDFVDRDMVLYKLLLNGVDGKIYFALKSIYAGSESCVRINNMLSEWFSCSIGTKQGDCISPTIFSIFINDLVADINALDLGVEIDNRKISLLLYADDIVSVASSENDLQKMLDTLSKWCNKWRVVINTDKSKCMHFRSARHRKTEYQFKLGHSELGIAECYKYLGVYFHEHLDFSTHCNAISKGAGRALGGLTSKIRKMKDFGFKTYEKLYFSCVAPILDYGSSTWRIKSYRCLDNIQNRAMRFFMGVHRYAPITALIGDINWLPCLYRHWLNIVRFWNRLIRMDNNRLTKAMFHQDCRLCNNNWSSDFKVMLNKLGLDNFFGSKSCIDLTLAEYKINIYYKSIWTISVENLPKLRTYRLFKQVTSTEKYIIFNLSRHERHYSLS